MEQFRSTLEICGLADLGYKGSRFTWNNCRSDNGFIKERLDRALANKEWCLKYQGVEILILAERSSDHKPILLVERDKIERCGPHKKGFKFEARWWLDEEYANIVEGAWGREVGGTNAIQCAQLKLDTCKVALSSWSRRKFGDAEVKVKEKTKKLEELQRDEVPADREEIKQLKGEIDYILEQEDVRWKQRAKQSWFQYGDRNTPYFHAWATHRKKISHIRKIIDEDGKVWKKDKDVGQVFTRFYQGLFTSTGTIGVETCLEGLERRVTAAMNDTLLKTFTPTEVEAALAQMGPLKSPGPDGFSASFYQKSWGTVRNEVCHAALDFLNHGNVVPSINDTYIALIPKKKNPSFAAEFRPISLCNVLYKLIAKVLANRMKKVLPSVISPSQSAFVPGMLITDNILVAFEALHTMDTRMTGKKGYMTVKLDMSKAYDRVEWNFLEAIMVKIGFASRWVQMIMTCVRTVSFSVLVNGIPYGKITPTRGIRQGDPLSPYLFILCAEGLSNLLYKAKLHKRITGLPVTRGGTRLNHLFFADDSLLFCRATIFEWIHIQEVLEIYEMASRQKLNRDKTSIFFSKNTRSETKAHIKAVAGVGSTNRYEKYLGLPSLIGKSRLSSFNGIKSRIWECINGWKEKFLSQAGKEVLLKAVVQAIPTYTMSVFQLPKTLCKDINSMMAQFWWGHKDNKSKMSWLSWKKMGLAKDSGGLGFRDLEWFNLALLAKQGWRLVQNPGSLVAKILKEKYFPNNSFLEADLGRRPSFTWRSIWNSKKLLKEGLVWRVGDGRSINIWRDKWLPKPPYVIRSAVRYLEGDAKVCDLLDMDTNWWRVNMVHEIFNVEEATDICSMAVCPNRNMDRLAWACTANGEHTVKSAYYLAKTRFVEEEGSSSNQQEIKAEWNDIWAIKGSRVVKFFLWKACRDILPTKERLFRKHITEDLLCPICKLYPETIDHILWSCGSAKDVWTECSSKLQKCSTDMIDFRGLIIMLMERLNVDEMHEMATVARLIWLRRNSFVFDGEFTPLDVLVRNALDQVAAFNQADLRLNGRETTVPRNIAEAWQCPEVGCVKLNWDAAVDKANNKIGLGVIVRDSTSMVVAMQCSTRDFLCDSGAAEALGAWTAANLSCTLGLQRIILEGDAQEVVLALCKDGICRGSYGNVLNDAKFLLTHVPEWRVKHVRRSANMAAHRLAKMALVLGENRIWRDDYPSSMREIVIADNCYF
jgi:hypothetical protein